MSATIDLTCGGKLAVHGLVNPQKFAAMKTMVESALRGGWEAEKATLQARETLSTTDGVYSLAHLMNVRNLPKYEKAERKWSLIADVETVDDFKPITFRSFEYDFEGLGSGSGTKGHQVAPRVPELGTYSYAYGYTEQDVKAAIEKRGFKYGMSLESLIGDFTREIRTLPEDMLQVALDTDEFLVFDRLNDLDPSRALQAGVDPITGVNIAPNAPASAAALREGLRQIGARVDSKGRRVPVASSYYAVVGLGQGDSLEEDIRRYRTAIRFEDGRVVYGTQDFGRLGQVAGVIESEFFTKDGGWALVPAAGASRRPGLKKLQLAGHTAPEVLVAGFGGNTLRNAAGSPFDLAHFDNDSIDLKLRQFTNSALVTQDQLVHSDGSGVAAAGPETPIIG